MSNYTVRPGETIGDVIMNATGSIVNWDAILATNGFTDWTPELIAGQVIVIPDDVVQVDANTKRQLAIYPACNASVNDLVDKIAAIDNILSNNWILDTGFWNDTALWIDTKIWND